MATTAATLTVAFLGYQMLSGRVSIRNALRVILGCFILLGSSAIARGLLEAGQGIGEPAQTVPYSSPPPQTSSPGYTMPTTPGRTNGNPFDPYGGNRRTN
jgi:hypothetical protein